jgi:hypothetical protein
MHGSVGRCSIKHVLPAQLNSGNIKTLHIIFLDDFREGGFHRQQTVKTSKLENIINMHTDSVFDELGLVEKQQIQEPHKEKHREATRI